ncbi:hypothetical protein [Bacillus sp. Marseille-P3661]|uniref:hypothetical protein n=1 Tax=Bacillus sp. Marseille-P3661 TaxID=1936234 RepID=UPI000C837852|nr:hypothetical protein [Bacillus sp. Marseille-P3661]
MDILVELLKINVEFYEFLNKGFPEDENRDEQIDKIFTFLNKRSQVLPKLTQPITEDEQRLVATILDYHNKIEEILNKNKMLLKKEIIVLNQKKVQSKGYNNPYELYPTDGVFLDKRK